MENMDNFSPKIYLRADECDWVCDLIFLISCNTESSYDKK